MKLKKDREEQLVTEVRLGFKENAERAVFKENVVQLVPKAFKENVVLRAFEANAAFKVKLVSRVSKVSKENVASKVKLVSRVSKENVASKVKLVSRVSKGDRGEQGIDGQTGAQGIQGERGEAGLQGERGIQGEQGERGSKGEQGIQGERGIQGQTGERGEQGIQGQTGERGEQGIQGALGEQGERGIQGQTGERGEQGIQGEIGPSGKDAIIPDLDSIIEPFITKTQTHIDGYIDKSEKTFKSWQSIVNSQLSSVGGGGEVWLRHLNDVDRASTRVDGAFLKYNAATKKWVGDASISSSITLTGYSSTTGVISSADSIVSAVSKLNGNTALKAPTNSPSFTGTVSAGNITSNGNYILTRSVPDYIQDTPVTWEQTFTLTPENISRNNNTTITLPARTGTVLLSDEVSATASNNTIVRRNGSGGISANNLFASNLEINEGNFSFIREITIGNDNETAVVTLTCETPSDNNGTTITFPAQTGTVALLSNITGTNSGTNTGDQDLSSYALKNFAVAMAIALG